MSNGFVSTEIENNIAYITFGHPKSNSLPGDILRELANQIDEAGRNSDAKVIVLQSKGDKAFCAGASFDELLSIDNFEDGKRFFSGFAGVINAMRKAPKFIVGRIQGKAVGGGVGLAASCDYAIAQKSASIKLSEFALGIGPFVVGPAVERKIGKAAFAQFATDIEWYDSQWAFNRGLYAKVVDTIEDLDTEVTKMAFFLAESSSEATVELKRMYWEGTEDWDELLDKRAEISGRLVLSEFTKNYIRQFKNS